MARTSYTRLTALADRVLPRSFSRYLRSMIRHRRDLWNQGERKKREVYWEQNRNKSSGVTVGLQPGVRLELFFDSDLSRLIYRGSYEIDERHFLNAFLRRGDLFIDIGANIGLFTVMASKIVGAEGRVHAFEPCVKTVQRLSQNIRLNQCANVTTHQAALSDRSGETEMSVSLGGFDAWNSLAARDPAGDFAAEKVKTVAWDEIAESIGAGQSVAAMKVDIEGWESHFIAGAARFLSRPDAPVLLMEFNDAAARHAQSSGQEVYQQLEKIGYRFYKYDSVRQQLSPEPLRESYDYVNLVAVKQLEPVTSRLAGAWVPWLY